MGSKDNSSFFKPSGWLLAEYRGQDEYRIYASVPPSVVIDDNRGKVYVVYGTYQLELGLEPSESGSLVQTKLNGRGYIDLDRLEKLIPGLVFGGQVRYR